VPTHLNAEQKTKLREFAALGGENADANPGILEKAKKLFQ
jgi:hypothetical protein